MKKKLIIVSTILLIGIPLIIFQACKKETVSNPSEPPPTSDFIATPTSGLVPLTVYFTDKSTNNPNSWLWDFGDGNTSSKQNPLHIYNNAGTYQLSLVVENDFGTDSAKKTNYITVSINGNAPSANFIADPTSGLAPLTVNFTDQSNHSPTTWYWEFGDGDTSSQQNPSHTYDYEGNFYVTLTVENDFGTDTKTILHIYVNNVITDIFTDPRDSQTYNTVEIGNKTWFAENLNYDTGTNWCYDDDSSNCNIYGRLYDWETAKEACPEGWHLPTDSQWKFMERYIGMSEEQANDDFWRGNGQGEQLKSTFGWNSDGNGTDYRGFTALPGGHRDHIFGYENSSGDSGYWWTATERYNMGTAWLRGLHSVYDQVLRITEPKQSGLSVRCVKD